MKYPDVMPAQCATCVFRDDGKAVALRPGRLAEIQKYLIGGTRHVCHTAQAKDPKSQTVCRGGRDWQLTVWHRMGILSAPTDEALAEAMRDAGGGP